MRLHMRMAGASDPVLELMDAVRGVDRVPVADTVSAETCPICLDAPAVRSREKCACFFW